MAGPGWRRGPARHLRRAVVAAISQQVSDAALVELGEPVQRVQRRGMARSARPEFPVGDILEGLRIIRPARGPPCGRLRLAPAVCLPQGYPRVDPVDGPEFGRDLGPCPPPRAQLPCKQRLRLPQAARFSTHMPTFAVLAAAGNQLFPDGNRRRFRLRCCYLTISPCLAGRNRRSCPVSGLADHDDINALQTIGTPTLPPRGRGASLCQGTSYCPVALRSLRRPRQSAAPGTGSPASSSGPIRPT